MTDLEFVIVLLHFSPLVCLHRVFDHVLQGTQDTSFILPST